MDKQKQIEEMENELSNIQTYSYMEIYPCRQLQSNKIVAEHLIGKGYRKIPENAVVLTMEELKEKIDCCDVSMIHHDDDGKRYIEYEKYEDFTDRLGKRIQQLKGQLKQARNETAEKFAERLKAECKTDYINSTKERAIAKIDEIAKKITEEKE